MLIYTPPNSISDGPVTNLLWTFCILIEIHSCEAGMKALIKLTVSNWHFYLSFSEWQRDKHGSERVKEMLWMESKWSQVNCKAKSVKMSYSIVSVLLVLHFLQSSSSIIYTKSNWKFTDQAHSLLVFTGVTCWVAQLLGRKDSCNQRGKKCLKGDGAGGGGQWKRERTNKQKEERMTGFRGGGLAPLYL